MLTDQDLQKISRLLDLKLDQKLDDLETRLKKYTQQYVHEGVDAVINAIDELMAKDIKPRLKKLEQLRPQGLHV